jgi:sirohydrochlorin ferrochelatase
MLSHRTNDEPVDAEALALAALAATLTDERRARRFLELTGLDADELRARAGERGLLAALLGFLEAHEPDLVDVAQAIGIKPEKLVSIRSELER